MVTIGGDSHKRTHTFVAVDEVGRKVAETTVAATTDSPVHVGCRHAVTEKTPIATCVDSQWPVVHMVLESVGGVLVAHDFSWNAILIAPVYGVWLAIWSWRRESHKSVQ